MDLDKFISYANYNDYRNRETMQNTMNEMRRNRDNYMKNKYLDDFLVRIGTDEAECVLKNFNEEIVCLLTYEAMKEKVYNSLSLGIKTNHNALKTGDYITQRFKFSPDSQPRNYIVRSLPQIEYTHDYSFLLVCQQQIKIIGTDNTVHSFPCYFEDNRTRLAENDRNYNIVVSGSQYQFIVQDNEHTRRMIDTIHRLIIKGRAYKIIGTENLVIDGLMFVGLVDSKIEQGNDNVELGIADYYKLIEPEKPIPTGEIAGENSIIIREKYQYTYPDVNTVWSVDNSNVIIEGYGNSCMVTCEDSKMVGTYFNLTATANGKSEVKRIKIINY